MARSSARCDVLNLFLAAALAAAGGTAAAQVAATPPKEGAVALQRPWEMRPLIEKTPCAGDAEEVGSAGSDPDISMPADATVFVMMHGNRFVAARDLADAFERANPGERVAYTAIPPVYTVRALEQGGLNVGAEKMFRPDVVMAPPAVTKALAEMKFRGELLEDRGLYSRVHGFVLMARAGDARVTGTDWKAILKDERLKLSLPGQQVPVFTSFGPLVDALGVCAAEPGRS